LSPLADRRQANTLAANEGFDGANFVTELREITVTPHVAGNTTRRSAIDRPDHSAPGYAMSQRIRKRSEEGFG